MIFTFGYLLLVETGLILHCMGSFSTIRGSPLTPVPAERVFEASDGWMDGWMGTWDSPNDLGQGRLSLSLSDHSHNVDFYSA